MQQCAMKQSREQAAHQAFRSGIDLHRQGSLDEAARHYAMALRHHPGHFDALNNLGTIRAQRADTADEAVSLFRRAIRINPRVADSHNNLANVLRLLHRYQQAKYRRETAGGGWDNTSESLEIRENKRIRGGGSWSAQTRRLDRARRHREREQRNNKRSMALGKGGTIVAAGALILGAVLLMSHGTRGAGLVMLVLAGLALYVITGHKHA